MAGSRKEWLRRQLGPVVLVLATPAAEVLAQTANLKLCELFRPFSPVQGSVGQCQWQGTT